MHRIYTTRRPHGLTPSSGLRLAPKLALAALCLAGTSLADTDLRRRITASLPASAGCPVLSAMHRTLAATGSSSSCLHARRRLEIASDADKTTEYRVIVDAGSSGTRANIYAFTNNKPLAPRHLKGKKCNGGTHLLVDNKTELIAGEWDKKKVVNMCESIFKSIRVVIDDDYHNQFEGKTPCTSCPLGLSKIFNFDPVVAKTNVAKSIKDKWSELKEEMETRNTCVCKNGYQRIPVTVTFLATEGMRTYNRHNTAGDNPLMRAITAQFMMRCKKFGYEFNGAEILPGEMEATGAWIDAECMHNKLPEEGIIEMGGASMQSIMDPSSKKCFEALGRNAA